jgi:hypothetical protein
MDILNHGNTKRQLYESRLPDSGNINLLDAISGTKLQMCTVFISPKINFYLPIVLNINLFTFAERVLIRLTINLLRKNNFVHFYISPFTYG